MHLTTKSFRKMIQILSIGFLLSACSGSDIDKGIYATQEEILASNTVLAAIGASNEANESNVSFVELSSIRPALTGLIKENLAAYQAYIADPTNSFLATATQNEVQKIITEVNEAQKASNTVLAIIGANESNVSLDQLNSIWPALSGVASDLLHLLVYQAYIRDANDTVFTSPATRDQVQKMIADVNASQVVLAEIGVRSSSLTITKLREIYPALRDINNSKIEMYQAYISNTDNNFSSPAIRDQVQAMIDALNTEQEAIVVSPVDITNALLSNRDSYCGAYVNRYISSVTDLSRGLDFEGNLSVSLSTNLCTFETNSIPNHNFGSASVNFATDVSAVRATHSVVRNPVFASSVTELSLRVDNALFLNGVKLDLLAAACYGVGNGRIGCGQNEVDVWRYDPMSELNNFATDNHNAHTQPTGAYHYHGNPKALFDENCLSESPVIGFAADGFPIYGPCIDDGENIREVVSSYGLKEGARVKKNNEDRLGRFPGGNYDGTYIDDYEFKGTGDLDECNGKLDSNGLYGYYVSNAYPWVLKCFKGVPHESFNKNAPTTGGETGAGGSAEVFPGYMLVAPLRSKKTYLIDQNAQSVHTWTSAYDPGLAAYLLEDASLLRIGKVVNTSRFKDTGGVGGIIEKIAPDSNVTWSYEQASDTMTLHHDIEPLPNGNILAIMWVYKSSAEAIAQGRNPNLLANAELWPDRLVEINPSTNAIVWEWNVWDHLIQDFNSSLPNFGLVSQHPELINLNHVNQPRGIADWTHFNSLSYNEDLDQIAISVHGFNEVWVIDHSTTSQEAASHVGGSYGKGGDLLFRWGNPQTYDTAGTHQFYGQHDAQWDGDDLILFNNGQRRPDGNYSTIDKLSPLRNMAGAYSIDASSGFTVDSFTEVYKDPEPSNFYAQNISGVDALPNGNYLICDGPKGFIFEVDASGEILWSYQNTDGTSVFKVRKYALNYSGLNGIVE